MSQLKRFTAAAHEWRREAASNPWFFRGIAVAVGVTIADQLSKMWILHGLELPERLRPCVRAPEAICGQIALTPIFDLTFVRNYGASFGMLSGMRYLLSLLSITIVVALVIWLARLRRPTAVIGVGFIIGGALGNLYDRLAYGYVVDFLDFSGLMFPWVFNVADAGINVGVALLLLDAFQTRNTPEEAAPGNHNKKN